MTDDVRSYAGSDVVIPRGNCWRALGQTVSTSQQESVGERFIVVSIGKVHEVVRSWYPKLSCTRAPSNDGYRRCDGHVV